MEILGIFRFCFDAMVGHTYRTAEAESTLEGNLTKTPIIPGKTEAMESLKNSHSLELLAAALGALSTAPRLAYGTGRRLRNEFLNAFARTARLSEPSKNYSSLETVKFKSVAIATTKVAAAGPKYGVNGIGTKPAPQFRRGKVSQTAQILSLLRPYVAHSHAPLLFSGLSYNFRIGSRLLALRNSWKLSARSGATC